MHLVDDVEQRQAEQLWLSGGSAIPLLTLLASRGAAAEAGAVGRVALGRAGCADAEQIEQILERLSGAAPDWIGLLDAFAAAPSVERWRQLMHFVPPELTYERQRSAILYLRRRKVDPDILFLCACEYGLTPDAIELVEEGRVHVATILERAKRSGGARATYVGLAAEAAFLAGDLLGTIRLLRESIACESEWCIAFPHVIFVRERASDAENHAFDRARIPAW